DDAQAQELFAMLLPALLQSYGYGPGQGSSSSGDAAAVGNESQTFTKQVAMAAASGDGVVDIVQDVLVANMGAASANTGGNTIGSVRTLDPDTARAVVMMAAFMAQLLALVHQSASSTALAAQSQGIEIPFGDLVLTLDGAFDGLDTTVAQGGARANIRQVSIVVSLGIARANSGLNTTVSETQSAQGNRINGGGAGDSVVVLALDAAGNVVSTGRADAASGQVITICQRLNADDVACLAPPTTTTPPAPTPVATTPAAVSSAVDAASSAAPATPGAVPVAAGPAAAAAPSAFRTPAPALTTRGSLPATGTDVGTILAGATGLLFLGIALLAVRRRRPVA
ncbi:MAG: LPXTG cell wall anchor domain-containing protein, partial [Ilumatobacteraceae bacterium]